MFREEVKQWVREQAKMFLDRYFAVDEVDGEMSEDGLLDNQSLLKQLSSISRSLMSCAVSSFLMSISWFKFW